VKICMLNILHEADDKRVFHKVARSLREAGREVVSVCPRGKNFPEDRYGVEFIEVPMPPSKKKRLVSVLRLIRHGLRIRADVYFAPEPESWTAALIVKLLKGGRPRVVFDMHEHVPTEFAKFFPAVLRGGVEKITVRFMRLFARFTDLIILTRNSFEAPWAGLKTPRVTVINTNHAQPPCHDIPRALVQQYAGRPTIIHQGVFGDVRGSWQLLDAMKILAEKIPEIRCIILGEYLYGDEKEYRDAIREAGLEEYIHLPGSVPFVEVPAWIAVSQIGLILFQPGPRNHTLAMPHKLFDYMREMIPVIAPDFAAEVAHIVNESDCGLLVDVTSAEAIADAVLHLIERPDEMQRLGRNGRRAVEEKYNWEQDAQRLTDAFAALEGDGACAE
jgi:glycosyltransferase involved in cell wall biosynthesis